MSEAMANDAELHCPECGYDLRATEAGRCPECGSAFDRAAMSQSRIAWEHRRSIGRVRAWWRTVWQATFRVRQFADSVSAPVDGYGARRFWLINAVLIFLPLAVLSASFREMWQGFAAVDVERFVMLGASWQVDVLMPFHTAYAATGLRLVFSMGLVLMVTAGQSYLLQVAPRPRELQSRAAALGLYLSGACIGATMLALAVAVAVLAIVLPTTAPAGIEAGFIAAAWVAGVLFCGTIWLSNWRLYRRVTRAGVLRSMLIGVAIPGLWVLAGALWLIVVPWCLGLLIVIGLSILG